MTEPRPTADPQALALPVEQDSCVDGHEREPLLQAATLFDARERAALSLAESVIHVSTTRVPADVWAEAKRHLGTDDLANLLFIVAAINGWDRLAIGARTPPRSAASTSPA